jgi:hypothetical protein
MNAIESNREVSASPAPSDQIVPFMHTFPKTPVSPAYQALAVRHGFNAKPVFIFEGRQCFVHSDFRVAGRPGRYGHSRLTIKFLDNGEITTVAAGVFAKKAKNP